MPFTIDEYLAVLEGYNRSIWPLQIIAYGLGALAILLAIKRTAAGDRVIGAVLSVFWLWSGVFYHILNCRTISHASFWFGLLFVAQGLLLLITLAARGGPGFQIRFNVYGITGAVFVLYALLMYPLLGPLFGHNYPRSPEFGVSPDTVTIFTFGLLLWADRPVPRYLFILPFIWAMIGSIVALAVALPEDIGLFVAGIAGSLLILHRERREITTRLKSSAT